MLMPVVERVKRLRSILTFQRRDNDGEQRTKFLNREHVINDEAIPIEWRPASFPALVQKRIHATTHAA
jgi:hypothetical protein